MNTERPWFHHVLLALRLTPNEFEEILIDSLENEVWEVTLGYENGFGNRSGWLKRGKTIITGVQKPNGGFLLEEVRHEDSGNIHPCRKISSTVGTLIRGLPNCEARKVRMIKPDALRNSMKDDLVVD